MSVQPEDVYTRTDFSKHCRWMNTHGVNCVHACVCVCMRVCVRVSMNPINREIDEHSHHVGTY